MLIALILFYFVYKVRNYLNYRMRWTISYIFSAYGGSILPKALISDVEWLIEKQLFLLRNAIYLLIIPVISSLTISS
jgi:hypothetical protein